MFTTGMPPMTTGFFSAASMAVSVPAGIQVFSRIATLAIGKPRLHAPGLFVLGSIVIFVTGGHTGGMRTEDRRVGKERVRQCSARGWPYHYKQNIQKTT